MRISHPIPYLLVFQVYSFYMRGTVLGMSNSRYAVGRSSSKESAFCPQKGYNRCLFTRSFAGLQNLEGHIWEPIVLQIKHEYFCAKFCLTSKSILEAQSEHRCFQSTQFNKECILQSVGFQPSPTL